MTTLREAQDSAYNKMSYLLFAEKTLTNREALDIVIEAERLAISTALVEALEGKIPSMDVDEYVAIIKAGNWDEMYEAGVKATRTEAQNIIKQLLESKN